MNNFHFENDKNLYLNPFTRIPFEEFLQFLVLFKNTIEYFTLTSLIALTQSQLYKYNVDIRKKKRKEFFSPTNKNKTFSRNIYSSPFSFFKRKKSDI